MTHSIAFYSTPRKQQLSPEENTKKSALIERAKSAFEAKLKSFGPFTQVLYERNGVDPCITIYNGSHRIRRIESAEMTPDQRTLVQDILSDGDPSQPAPKPERVATAPALLAAEPMKRASPKKKTSNSAPQLRPLPSKTAAQLRLRQICALKKQLKTAQTERARALPSRDALQRQATQPNQQESALRAQVSTLESQIQTKAEDLAAAEKSLNEALHKLDAMQGEQTRLEKRLKEQTSQSIPLSSLNTQLTQQITQTQEQLREQEQSTARARKEAESSLSQFKEASGQLSTLQAQLKIAEQNARELREQVVKLTQASKTQPPEALVITNSPNPQLEEQLALAKKANAQLEKLLQDQTDAAETARRQTETFGQQTSQIRTELETQTQANQLLRRKLEDQQKNRSQIEQLQEIIAKLKKEAVASAQAFDRDTDMLRQVANELAQYKEFLQQARTTQTTQAKTIASFEESSKTQNAAIKRLQDQNQALTTRVQQLTHENGSLPTPSERNEMELLQAHNKALNTRLERLTHERDELSSRLQKQFDEFQEQNRELQAQLETQEQEQTDLFTVLNSPDRESRVTRARETAMKSTAADEDGAAMALLQLAATTTSTATPVTTTTTTTARVDDNTALVHQLREENQRLANELQVMRKRAEEEMEALVQLFSNPNAVKELRLEEAAQALLSKPQTTTSTSTSTATSMPSTTTKT